MHAFFDSPETIRNKVKEFKTATFNGLNKQDVMNYLSLISEQQGVMIRLLRENNIPLFVDDGYEQEEQFVKPVDDNQDYLSQYLGGSNTDIIAEMQAEIEALQAENNALKMSSSHSSSTYSTSSTETNLTDFDTQFGINNNIEDETAQLRLSIEEKDLYIQELEAALNNSSMSNIDFNMSNETNDNSLSDIERQAYEEEIVNLRNEIENLKATEGTTDLFNSEVVSIDEDVKLSYEQTIDSLREELNETKEQLDEALALAESKELELADTQSLEFNLAEPMDINESVNNEEIENLKATIDDLNSTISNLQSEINTYKEQVQVLELSNANTDDNIDTAISNQEISINLDEDEEQTAEELIESLKTTIEVLEMELSRTDKEKATVEFRLEEISNELLKYTSYKDEDGNTVSIDMASLVQKHTEIVEMQKLVADEKNDVEEKLKALQEKEDMIESNKHLVSQDYVESITLKEQEIDRLRKQMDKMLTVAQATADDTEKEAQIKATQMLDEAKTEAASILTEANEKKTQLIEEADATLANAKEFKTQTEAEAEQLKEETRQTAEEMIAEAESKANQVIEEAQLEAQKTQDEALSEINKITAEAEQKVVELDNLIQSKEKEIDNIQKYYLKVKNDGLVGVKKLYNQLENIIYSDEIS